MSFTLFDPSQINGILKLTGGTLTGILNMGSNKITNLANGTVSTDAINLSQLTANGTVNSGTAGQLAYYPSTGTAVSGSTPLTVSSNVLSISGGNAGLTLATGNTTSAWLTLTTAAYNYTLTLANNGQVQLRDVTNSKNAWYYDPTIGIGTTVFDSAINATGGISMSSSKITGLANGTASTDAVAFGQLPSQTGTITNWVVYTPTYGGLGTVTNSHIFWRRIGDTIEIRGSFATGTPTATAASISLPNSNVADNSGKIPSVQVCGYAVATTQPGVPVDLVLSANNGSFYFGLLSSGGNAL